MPKIAKPFITNGDDSPAYWQIGNLWQIMATGVQTDNSFTLLDQVVHEKGGGGPVTHSHSQDEGLYVISGHCTFNAGGHQGLDGAEGTFVMIPGDCEHSFTVDAPNTHVLNFYLPAGFEQLLIGVAHPAPERKPPPYETIPDLLPPKAHADKLSEQYGETNTLGNPFTMKPDPTKMYTNPTPGATYFPYLTEAAKEKSYWLGGGVWSILADGPRTGDRFCLFEGRHKKGSIDTPHIHEDSDEIFYIFGGNMSFLLEDRIEHATTGALIFIPRGSVHCVRVDSDEAHFLNWHTPSGFERLIEGTGTATKSTTAPAADFKPEPVDEGIRTRIHKRIGYRPVAVADPLGS